MKEMESITPEVASFFSLTGLVWWYSIFFILQVNLIKRPKATMKWFYSKRIIWYDFVPRFPYLRTFAFVCCCVLLQKVKTMILTQRYWEFTAWHWHCSYPWCVWKWNSRSWPPESCRQSCWEQRRTWRVFGCLASDLEACLQSPLSKGHFQLESGCSPSASRQLGS